MDVLKGVAQAPSFVPTHTTYLKTLSAVPKRARVCNHSTSVSTPRRKRVECATTKLLVVDLQELLQTSAIDHLTSFSERVEVDRKSSKDTTFLLYTSQSGYDASTQSIKDAHLVEPDALSALDGSELYQRGYKLPDPYWEKTARKYWEPKPVSWTIQQFFGDCTEPYPSESEYELVYRCKEGIDRRELCVNISNKMKEMGIKIRVLEGFQINTIRIVPAGGSVAEMVAFCQMMLGIDENCTYIFGNDDLVESCVRGKGNMGLCSANSSEQWKDFGDRIYVSEDVGVDALLDGVMHHAVF